MNHIPSVTVIMPIRNEAAYIERSLRSVLAQDYPAERLQVIVVDGQSTDQTQEIVRQLAHSYQHEFDGQYTEIILLENPQQIVPTALNIGLTHAQGEVIVRVDGHCQVPANYISHCVALLQQQQVDCVGGPIQTIGETPVAATIALAMSSAFGVGGSSFRTVLDRTQFVDTLAFGAYTRQIMQRCGAFDEELVRNQDDEYNYRLRKLGGRILLSNAVRLQYYSRGTLSKLWSQYYQYGYWKVRVLQKHPGQMQWRQFVPPFFVAALLGGLLSAPFKPIVWALWGSMLVLYLLANLTASAWTAARHGWRHLPLLPLVFAILHISYGLGFLVGLIRFAGRWRVDGQPITPAQTS